MQLIDGFARSDEYKAQMSKEYQFLLFYAPFKVSLHYLHYSF